MTRKPNKPEKKDKKFSMDFGFMHQPTNKYELIGFIAFLMFLGYIITISR